MSSNNPYRKYSVLPYTRDKAVAALDHLLEDPWDTQSSRPHPFQANTIGTRPNTFADAEYDDTEAVYAWATERATA
jgi:hypothetical protein